jgi:phosphatidylglycerophosphate synthase
MTDGERWARRELDALRAARFRPRAWSPFIVASSPRAAVNRAARPALMRQTRAWSAAGLAAGLAARHGVLRLGLPAPTRRAWLVWWLGSAAMLDWHLGMLEGPDGQRRDRLRAADALSLTRIGLAPFIAVAEGEALYSTLVAAGAATDFVDGRVARRQGTSRLGRDLDTSGDVALKLAAARAARHARWLTPNTSRLIATCQLAGVALVTTTYLCNGRRPTDERLREPRWTAPLLMSGLALAPRAPRIANALVGAASLGTLTIGLTRRMPSRT